MSDIQMTDVSGTLRPLRDYEDARCYYTKQLTNITDPGATLNAIVVIEILDVVIASLKRKGST